MPSPPPGGPFAVLSDFDGTITTEDVAEVLLARFAPGAWEPIEALHRARAIGTRETLARQFSFVHEARARLVDFARANARMDPAFPAFLAFCRSRGIPFEIASEGLDFYIEPLLRDWGLDVPLRTNRAAFDGGRIRIEYPWADPGCTLCGTCKMRRVFELRLAGRRVVYVGDGDSDLCPAVEADAVFAKARLAELRGSESIPCVRFESFAEVQREMEGWR